jgi:hypothetical protein
MRDLAGAGQGAGLRENRTGFSLNARDPSRGIDGFFTSALA